MKTLNEVKSALKAQKSNWLNSTTLWSDFSDDFETGMRQHKESIEHDFLTENDVVDQIEVCDENSELIGKAMEERTECLFDTIQALDLL